MNKIINIRIITSFCARLYSRRRAKRQTEQIIQSLNQEESHAADGTPSHQAES